MKNLLTWVNWMALCVLGIKYSIEWSLQIDIGWKGPILAMLTFQHLNWINKVIKKNENK
jgi:hypothetical protein